MDETTVLMIASTWADLSIVRSLLQAGADPSAKRPVGQTASDLAKRRGRKPVVELLDLAVRDRLVPATKELWRKTEIDLAFGHPR